MEGDARAERGRELVAEALEWISSSPKGWAELLEVCEKVDRRYGHVSRSVVYAEMERRRVRVFGRRTGFCRSHDLWSALVRLADRELGGRLRYRRDPRCCVDAAYPTPEELPALPGGGGSR